MNNDYTKDTDEVEYVEECIEDDCDAEVLFVTPEEMRRHLVEDHDEPLGILYVWPTEEERQRAIDEGRVMGVNNDG